MKKCLSVLLAVVMLASYTCFGVSAAEEVDLLKNGAVANNSEGCTVSQLSDGGYEAVVTKAWDSTTDVAYGFAIEPGVTSTDMTGMYVHMSIVSDVPFRISHLDRNDAGENKWITYTSEFFNSVVAKGKGEGTLDMLVNEKFFPAGTYECVAFLGGVYTWKTNNNEAGWDVTNGNITGLYIEAMEAGTMKLNSLKLSSDSTFSGAASSDTNDATTKGQNTTTAKKTTTTKKNVGGKEDGANTADVSKAALFVMVAVVAGTAVTLSVVSSKAKNR